MINTKTQQIIDFVRDRDCAQVATRYTDIQRFIVETNHHNYDERDRDNKRVFRGNYAVSLQRIMLTYLVRDASKHYRVASRETIEARRIARRASLQARRALALCVSNNNVSAHYIALERALSASALYIETLKYENNTMRVNCTFTLNTRETQA